MKKYLSIMLCVLMVFAVSSCDSAKEKNLVTEYFSALDELSKSGFSDGIDKLGETTTSVIGTNSRYFNLDSLEVSETATETKKYTDTIRLFNSDAQMDIEVESGKVIGIDYTFEYENMDEGDVATTVLFNAVECCGLYGDPTSVYLDGEESTEYDVGFRVGAKDIPEIFSYTWSGLDKYSQPIRFSIDFVCTDLDIYKLEMFRLSYGL